MNDFGLAYDLIADGGDEEKDDEILLTEQKGDVGSFLPEVRDNALS